MVAKWVLAVSARPSLPHSATTRRPASTTCVAPRGSRNPTRFERLFDLPELPGPRHYGRRRDGRVVLGPGTHLQPHATRDERFQVIAGGPGELVHHHDLDLARKFTDDPGVDLAEQPVDVAGGVAAGFVLTRGERDDADVFRTDDLEDALRDHLYAENADLFGIPDACLLQLFRLVTADDPDACDDEGAEVVALPGLVDAKPRRAVEGGPRPGGSRRSPRSGSPRP